MFSCKDKEKTFESFWRSKSTLLQSQLVHHDTNKIDVSYAYNRHQIERHFWKEIMRKHARVEFILQCAQYSEYNYSDIRVFVMIGGQKG